MFPESTELLRTGSLEDFCTAYAESAKIVDDALLSITNARARMARLVERFYIIPDRVSDFDFDVESGAERLRESVAGRMKRSAWSELIRMTRVTDVMIESKRNELNSRIESGDVPEVTIENVVALLRGLRGDIGKIVDESIAEASRVLRPNNLRYVTNSDGWQLGPKAIVEWAVESWGGGKFHVTYGSGESKLLVIDNAFHLLDGKGVPAHGQRLVDAIRSAGERCGNSCETDYFRCRWFKNRNLHIEFKRLDLVDELNRRTRDDKSLRQPAA